MKKVRIADWQSLKERQPAYALAANVDLMNLLAETCGHTGLSEFRVQDLTTWKPEMADDLR